MVQRGRLIEEKKEEETCSTNRKVSVKCAIQMSKPQSEHDNITKQ